MKIALGTDSAVAPHSQANKELELMVTKGGMSARDALIAATKGGPDLMDLSNETGTLDPGKSADLIAVEETRWSIRRLCNTSPMSWSRDDQSP